MASARFLSSSDIFVRVRAAAILGLGCSERDLRPFQENSRTEWILGLPGQQSEADAVLIFGGDGTVHRHLAALVKLGLPVLVVPRGSGNDFARALGIRRTSDALASWSSFASGAGTLRAIDLGVIRSLNDPSRLEGPPGESGSAYFCCVGGVGLDGEVARRANQLPRWLRGLGGYALSLLPALTRFKPVPVTLSLPCQESSSGISPRTRLTTLALFANTPNYGGGMVVAPRARMDDGQLDICWIPEISRLKLFCLFPTVYLGRHLGIECVEYFQTPSLRITTESPLDIYADGEFVCQTPVEVSVAPGALTVIV